MQDNLINSGLTNEQVKRLQKQYGKNELATQKRQNFLRKLLHVICEPMFLLLIAAAMIYFILGEPRDGSIMLIFVVFIISIEAIQEWKTDRTLNKLKDLSAPQIKVIRESTAVVIASVDLVPGDVMIIIEGTKIPADGWIIKANDLCIDESSLTGEAEGVWKIETQHDIQIQIEQSADYWRKDYCYAGTLVTQGSATIVVDKIGSHTEYGKIGTNIAEVKEHSTPLQRQISKLVTLCSIIAALLFLLTTFLTYLNIPDHAFKDRLIESILSGITLAMAMIPEEFPVILIVFLSMGAWRLAKKHSLVRKLPAVETLGAVSVLCVDKTGTITLNQMTVQTAWSLDNNTNKLIETMGLACETEAYDPMEKAMLAYCEHNGFSKALLFGGRFIMEYAFTNELKMMGHIWQYKDAITIAAKGSPESILSICQLTAEARETVESKIAELSNQGLRVIAVGTMNPPTESDIPKALTDCQLTLCGLIGLADPPRASVKKDIQDCLDAGIRVVMITGDNGTTASAIAKQVGILNADQIMTGAALTNTTDAALREKVRTVSIFSRVLPAHKMRIVRALQENGEVVAMTGDGVNDAPALKYADIGIAMGKRGSEVSREAADLILLDDNFSTIVGTINDGRRIYDNIRKAIGYVFTIHIPIALATLLAPLLSITPASLMLLPLHVVLLELIIDPTCAIVLERQPAERDIMKRKPRDPSEKIITLAMLSKSIAQGLIIFIAAFGMYYYMLQQNSDNAAVARTMGLITLMVANMFLVLVNSSEYDSFNYSIRLLIQDKVMWVIYGITISGVLLIVYSPLNYYLRLAPLSMLQLSLVVGVAALSVLWYELIKMMKRR